MIGSQHLPDGRINGIIKEVNMKYLPAYNRFNLANGNDGGKLHILNKSDNYV